MSQSAAMIREITGTAVAIRGNDIDTDRIIPARYMKELTFDRLGQYSFFDQRFDSSGKALDHPLNDPRFERIPPDELNDVKLEVSLLSPMDPIAPGDVEVGRHGLMIEHRWNRGLLLPKVATEHGLDREGFLDALCHKADLPSGAWRDPQARLLAFTAVVFEGSLSVILGDEPR